MLAPALVFLTLAASAIAAPTGSILRSKRDASSSGFPFSQIVAFGDNLSDNGNGSVAHGVAQPGQPDNSIYGYRTWTDGPVAVSYLATNLGIPLAADYAFGHEDGGSKFGATIDNDYTKSTVPSAKDQIANYTSTGDLSSVGDTLHFLWIGANDINLYHIYTWFAVNHPFGDQMASMMVDRVQSLVDAGANYVFVPNLYPKQISPSSEFYCSNQQERQALGAAIEYANAQIAGALKNKFGDKVILYDVYGFMMNVWNNHQSYGITHVGGQFCDGYSQQDWNLCVTDGQGDTFYWMQYLDMTSTLHKMIADDMANAIKSFFGN